MKSTEPTKILSLNYHDSMTFFGRLETESDHHLHADEKRGCWSLHDSGAAKLWDFRPPLTFPKIISGIDLPSYRRQILAEPGEYMVLLVQAGSAALGVYRGW